MKQEILIIGYGSIGRKYYNLLNKEKKKYNVNVLSEHLVNKKNFINSRNQISSLNPDLIIICSRTSDHYKDLNLVNKNFKKIKILVEKPIFSKVEKVPKSSNKIYVGYNLRFHPLLIKLITLVKNKKIYSIDINCSSYLPSWRKNIDYSLSSSATDIRGGGVLKDLSHELDYLLLLLTKLKINFFQNKKISNLKIKTNDYFYLNASSGKTTIDMVLKYYSLQPYRFLVIDCKDTHYKLDLINNNLMIKSFKKLKIFRLKKFKIIDTYMKQVKSILNNENQACSIQEGMKVLKLIDQLK